MGNAAPRKDGATGNDECSDKKYLLVFLKPSIQMLGHYFEMGHNITHPFNYTYNKTNDMH